MAIRPPQLLAASATDRGLCRSRNEDAVLSTVCLQEGDPLAPVLVLAVADGMGGLHGGEIASALAMQAVERVFAKQIASGATGESGWFEVFAAAFAAAVSAMHERTEQDLVLGQMGTTLTCVVVHGDRIMFAHVGDSRAYLLRNGDLRQLTTDHNAAAELVIAGRLTEAEAVTHRSRNVLTRCLTAAAGPAEPPETGALGLAVGDVLLVCSDGLHTMMSNHAIANILGKVPIDSVSALESAAAKLLQGANANGGRDNISVALGTCTGL